jgi:hypothetical protein
MRSFVVKVFDEYVKGTQDMFTPTSLAELLGSVERLSCSGVVFATNGTSPTLTVQFQHSPDGTRWFNEQGTPELSALPLTNGAVNNTFTVSNVLNRALSHVRLRIAFGGSSPSGVVQVWICGRSPGG